MLLLMTLWIPFDTGVPDIVNDAVQVGLVKLILMLFMPMLMFLLLLLRLLLLPLLSSSRCCNDNYSFGTQHAILEDVHNVLGAYGHHTTPYASVCAEVCLRGYRRRRLPSNTATAGRRIAGTGSAA